MGSTGASEVSSRAPREDTVDRIFGHVVADPYRWLEDAGSARTADWLRLQRDRFARSVGEHPTRAAWEREVRALSGAELTGVPSWRAGRVFFEHTGPGREQPVLCAAGPSGGVRTVVDPEAHDPSGRTVLGPWAPSPEGDLVACQLSADGREEPSLYVLDAATGRCVEGPVDRTRGPAPAWVAGQDGFYYVRGRPADAIPRGDVRLHRRVHWHRIGTDPRDDPAVLGDGMDPSSAYTLSVSDDGRWLVVGVRTGGRRGNRLWLADLTAGPPGKPRFRAVDSAEGSHSAAEIGPDGVARVLTDDGASGRRLCSFDPADPDGPWTEVIAERPGAVLQEAVQVHGPDARLSVLALWSREACGELTLHDAVSGSLTARVPLPGAGTIGGLTTRPGGGGEAWFSYTDYTCPQRVLRYDARDGGVTPWRVPGRPHGVPAPAGGPGADAGWATTLRVHYRSSDGARVSMALVVPREAAGGPSGPRPLLMRGYGGFGVVARPHYGQDVAAWVRAGGVFAEPHIRGGGEQGEQWHRAGTGKDKQRTFDDFHAAARWLIDEGWTTPRHLAIAGTSNGGLLVGAAAVQQPQLYAAVSCAAPLLDMVRYERSGLGPAWAHEYGSASDPEQVEWLLSYSPYHHVREGRDYPAVLLSAFDNDTRVDPLHARKMCAALQHAAADPSGVLLRCEDLGHGTRPLSATIGFATDVLTFLADRTGLAAPGPDAARPAR
ncbi:prolyl oligopeptidase family serine peptidase [Streptomyces prasinopilosus]|uniref:prolyl oligopeptidase family serine peptidase n=1 Tax=Streptomyces prasinopilosus TaxID=67344 RepID=UPI0006EBCDEB|nr:prolyl oligopeptidase family serine peptidase [Streptomyces prasinopilosus]